MGGAPAIHTMVGECSCFFTAMKTKQTLFTFKAFFGSKRGIVWDAQLMKEREKKRKLIF
jgi:hypothetical protein